MCLLPLAQANAEPSLAEVQKQLDEAWEKLEPAIEQYDDVHSRLAANRKKSAALLKKSEPLRAQVELANSRVGALPHTSTGPVPSPASSRC
jgi:peptidoglycan DL-endopeptidase CwlO